MRINNNISAMNTYSRLTSAQGAQSKSLEKLSSGLRINRAGDDAAGLAISEKMRGQIKGLNQSVRNAQDGISLIQTAEGALNETHSILNRMRELAVQSANDTNTNADRNEIQKEMDQLSTEISRVSNNTEFNTQKLLNGTFTDKKFHIGANETQAMSISVNDMGSNELGIEGKASAAANITDIAGATIRSRDGLALTIAMKAQTSADTADVTETTASISGTTITVTLAQDKWTSAAGTINATKEDVLKALESTGEVIVERGTGYTNTIANEKAVTTIASTTVVGKDATYNKAIGVNVSTQSAADEAITTIDNAITTVSAERSKLGAVQNRLDHTINNLTATSENLSAAESRIRDVDMAKEMMEFTKNNILNQASTAMLAQANQMPQGVLQLLG